MHKVLSIVLLLMVTSFTGFSQEKKAQQSPRASAKGDNVEVSYGQPSKRGREIFGKLVPYGEVWRTGANEATEITFKKDGMFGGKPVKAGTYSLFTIPTEKSWELILNSELKQWGSFGYDKIKSKDVLHINAPVRLLPGEVEKLTITVKKDALLIEWDKTGVTVPMKF
ncbi:MAG: DUF2911 domain-containing protein [Bacteroidota bacterium]